MKRREKWKDILKAVTHKGNKKNKMIAAKPKESLKIFQKGIFQRPKGQLNAQPYIYPRAQQFHS